MHATQPLRRFLLGLLAADGVLLLVLVALIALGVGEADGEPAAAVEGSVAAVAVTSAPVVPLVSAPTTTAPPPPTTLVPADGKTAADRTLSLVDHIGGDISPKSIEHSGTGRFIAQNMMYRHTITVYDRTFQLLATIPDTVDLARFGHAQEAGEWQGSPVEAAFTSDGRYAYVTNYQMYGPGYGHPGDDRCADTGEWDQSFVYRLDMEALVIDQVIAVGAVPKYVSVTPDGRYVLVSNWCSYDLSIVDVAAAREVHRVDLGRFPRGIAVTSDSRTAYVAVMGSSDVAAVDLAGLTVGWLEDVGGNPRHVVLAPDDRFLYVTLNGGGKVVKIDLASGAVVGEVATGTRPRSMAISDDGTALYVVNYDSNTVSKVRTADMVETQELGTGGRPIGVTYDAGARQVWVANYTGSLQVFADR